MSTAPTQTEAQRLAADLEVTNGLFMKNEAAALLRRQDELLEQALDALEWGGTVVRNRTIAAIRAHREAK